MKIITIVGTRPQFIKAAIVSHALVENANTEIEEILVHTGQHHDDNMSKVFFDELHIPQPKYNLNISGGQHGSMTGRMLEAIEKILLIEKPDRVLVYGDTNSTLAAALAAAKLHIPIAHVEAGLRSFNMKMPEEVNRILTDRIATYLFCPTVTAIKNLSQEGMDKGVHYVGDVMYDAMLHYSEVAKRRRPILDRLELSSAEFVLATCHRAEMTDNPHHLMSVVNALKKIASEIKVVFPLHPRTRDCLERYQINYHLHNVVLIDPLPFLDMIILEQSAKVILTDSGGVQKEAFFCKVPCVTMRNETEWVETVTSGWNQLVGHDGDRIHAAVMHAKKGHIDDLPYGDGKACARIIKLLT